MGNLLGGPPAVVTAAAMDFVKKTLQGECLMVMMTGREGGEGRGGPGRRRTTTTASPHATESRCSAGGLVSVYGKRGWQGNEGGREDRSGAYATLPTSVLSLRVWHD